MVWRTTSVCHYDAFTASLANPVLAWGGHVSTRKDWGPDNLAVAIPGSPYHTRLVGLDGTGGNQDLSLSADAVIFPARSRSSKTRHRMGRRASDSRVRQRQ